jgi:hypothetical protein
MNQRSRFAVGAAIAGVLVAPPAALGSSPNPAGEPNGSTPTWPVTTVPLPEEVAQCLEQSGLPDLSADTKVDLPAPVSAPPASLAGTIPLPGTGVPTTSGTNPLSEIGVPTPTGTIPLSEIGVPTPTGTIPLSGVGVPTTATGTSPLPTDGGAISSGVQCGQVIINNTIYMVLVPLTATTTTTTTTANGPMTVANGPVTITDNAPAAAPVTTTDNAPAAAPVTTTPVATGRKKPRAKARCPRRKRSTAHKHSTCTRAKRALRVVLVRKSPGGGSRRVTALAAHAGRGS